MATFIFKCKACGGNIAGAENATFATCEYCGNTSTLPKVSDERDVNLFNRAEHLRQQNQFDKAIAAYENIVSLGVSSAEAHWGLVLAKYGIEYVKDPTTKRYMPTCHRVQSESILADVDYLEALKNADPYTKSMYEDEAKQISDIQKEILAISMKEKPYDVFICYKESANDGGRTKDSELAQDLHYHLEEEGYRVFFSRISLRSKLGENYEPYIFNALNTAKVMLVLGTKREYFNAEWVVNEWSRFLKLMEKDKALRLIPCYRDMDAYDLPEEFLARRLQAQDMGSADSILNILKNVKEIAGGTKAGVSQAVPSMTAGAQSAAAPGVESLMKRGWLLLEDSDMKQATEYFNKVLDIDPEYAPAYIGILSAELSDGLSSGLTVILKNFDDAKKIAVIKEVRAVTGLGLVEAKDLVEGTPKPLKERVSREEAAEIKDCITAAGGTVEISGSSRDKAGGVKIRKEVDLSNSKEPLDDMPNFQKALRFADVDYRAKLEGYNQTIKEHIRKEQYDKLIERKNSASTEAGYKCVAGQFREMGGYKDTEALAKECESKALKVAYDRLVQAKNRASNDEEYRELAKQFRSMNGYENTEELARECDNKHRVLKQQREEQERQEQYNRLLQAKNEASTEEEYQSFAWQFRRMNGYKNTEELAAECDNQYRIAKERREEQVRIVKEFRKEQEKKAEEERVRIEKRREAMEEEERRKERIRFPLHIALPVLSIILAIASLSVGTDLQLISIGESIVYVLLLSASFAILHFVESGCGGVRTLFRVLAHIVIIIACLIGLASAVGGGIAIAWLMIAVTIPAYILARKKPWRDEPWKK